MTYSTGAGPMQFTPWHIASGGVSLVAVVLVVASCATTVHPNSNVTDGAPATTGDRSGEEVDAGEVLVIDAVEASDISLGTDQGVFIDSSLSEMPPSGVLCLGTRCQTDEVCCYSNGTCLQAAEVMTACPVARSDGGDLTCAAPGQCPAGLVCDLQVRGGLCGGIGTCIPAVNCQTRCSGDCTACGCDGVTRTIEQLCLAEIPFSTQSPCGVQPTPGGDAGYQPIGCGENAQCPSGQHCCLLTGICVPVSCAGCCQTPPPGTLSPCETNDECRNEQYCVRDGCSGAGGCRFRPASGACPGVSAAVCGCDGVSYLNACSAAQQGTNVAHAGSC